MYRAPDEAFPVLLFMRQKFPHKSVTYIRNLAHKNVKDHLKVFGFQCKIYM